MAQKERNRLYVARCLLDGKMTIKGAAEILGLSKRQVMRIKKGVKEHGSKVQGLPGDRRHALSLSSELFLVAAAPFTLDLWAKIALRGERVTSSCLSPSPLAN